MMATCPPPESFKRAMAELVQAATLAQLAMLDFREALLRADPRAAEELRRKALREIARFLGKNPRM